MSVDSKVFRQTMANWTTGVTIITTAYEDVLHGMTASSFTSLSIDPLLVSISVNKSALSHDLIKNSGIFAVNILDVTQIELGKRFAGMLGDMEDRFEGITHTTAKTGAPILDHVVAWLDCRVHETFEGGDHSIFIGEVIATGINNNKTPLIYGNRQWGQFLVVSEKTVLKHVVMFRLYENTSENYQTIAAALQSLVGVIPEIRQLEVGRNVVESDRAYDIVLTVTFDSLADMEKYQEHPEHAKVVSEIIKPRISASVAVDYEI